MLAGLICPASVRCTFALFNSSPSRGGMRKVAANNSPLALINSSSSREGVRKVATNNLPGSQGNDIAG